MAYVETLRNPDFLCECFLNILLGERTLLTAIYSLDATVGIAVWSNIETGLGIFAGSLATLRPLLRMLRPGTGRSYFVNQASTPPLRTWANSQDRNDALPLSSFHAPEDEQLHTLKGNVRASIPIETGPGMTSSSVGTEDELSDLELVPPRDLDPYQINVRRDFKVTSSGSPV
jgi:hypothetical protein